MADALVRETEKLYGLAPTEFTAARNARAKELKQDDPELAAAVAALPKPSVAAAALNELLREDPSEVRALIQSGKRLRQAQEAAVSGKKGADLNAAIQEHRAALDRVQRDLRRRKLSGATLEKAIKTLRVTSVDPELQPLLERGILHEDLAASGFGLDPGLVPARPKRPAPRGPAKPKPPPKPKPDPKLRARLKTAEAELVDAEKRAAAALRDLERAKDGRRESAESGGRVRGSGVTGEQLLGEHVSHPAEVLAQHILEHSLAGRQQSRTASLTTAASARRPGRRSPPRSARSAA